MRLESPAILWVLFALPVLGYWLVRAERGRRRILRSLAAPNLHDLLLRGTIRAGWRGACLLAALASLAIAAAKPVRSAYDEAPRNDRDLFLVVDTSLSMAAEDVKPSRIRHTRDTIRALLSRMDGERVGVVAFAGSGILQAPLTRDYAAITMLVDAVATDLLPQPGSSPADGLNRALGGFPRNPTRSRTILLFTDGEEHDPKSAQIAGKLAQANVRLFILGVGTEEGAPIPMRDASGSLMGYKHYRGELVTTKLNAKLLRDLAERTGGQFFRASPDGHVVEPLLTELTRVADSPGTRSVSFAEILMGILAIAAILMEGWADRLPAIRLARRFLPISQPTNGQGA